MLPHIQYNVFLCGTGIVFHSLFISFQLFLFFPFVLKTHLLITLRQCIKLFLFLKNSRIFDTCLVLVYLHFTNTNNPFIKDFCTMKNEFVPNKEINWQQLHKHTHSHKQTHTYIHKNADTHAHVDTCTHTHTYTHTYTLTHTQRHSPAHTFFF